MTMASSTSQSSLLDSLGMIVSSLGPQMQDVTLLKMIGSLGMAAPVSAAWSE
jgi:hypothetical protein